MAPSLTKLGRFELIERLGVGGFGSVWKARDKELDRTVAIKIPRAGGMTAEEQEKFFREARAAAQLRHPSIVSVHEVGRDGDSVYIVSDFVRGVTLGDWLTGQKLTNREAAELSAKIADALHHAHEQGVVHRDLKPANIMIDGDGQPHLMDFGLARREVGEVTVTMDGHVLGTPAYMSPEQAEGKAHTADCRSDVYSLGVVLFQLLTGELPFRGNARMLMHQVIHDEPPSPRKLNSNLPKDLETITLKCLEKNPSRRYQNAHELAGEMRRFLSGVPISARPLSRVEHGWRWCKRKPLAAAMIVIGIFLAIGGPLVAISQAHLRRQAKLSQEQAKAETARAETAAEVARTQVVRSEQVAKFLKDMLEGAGPSVARGRDATLLREILDKTAQRVESELASQPEIQADLWFILGRTYGDIGENSRAVTMYESAVNGYRSALGNDSNKLAMALSYLGACQRKVFRASEGKINAQLGLEIARKRGDPETLATCLSKMAAALFESDAFMSRNKPGVPFLREAIKIRKELGTDPIALASCMSSLGVELQYTSVDKAEAEILIREALKIYRAHLEPDHPKIATSLAFLGLQLEHQGKLEDAEPVLREAVELFRKVFPPDDSSQYFPVRTLTDTLLKLGKADEAKSVLSQAVKISPSIAQIRMLRCSLPAYQREWSEAVEQAELAVESHPDSNGILFRASIILLEAGRPEEYRRLCHRYLELAFNKKNFNSSDMAAKASLLLPVDGADFKRACKLAESASAIRGDAEDKSNNRLTAWTQLLLALADYRQERFDSAIDHASRAIGDKTARTEAQITCWFIRAAACARLQQLESARKALKSGDDLLSKTGRALETWPDFSIAEHLRREAAGLIDDQPATAPQP